MAFTLSEEREIHCTVILYVTLLTVAELHWEYTTLSALCLTSAGKPTIKCIFPGTGSDGMPNKTDLGQWNKKVPHSSIKDVVAGSGSQVEMSGKIRQTMWFYCFHQDYYQHNTKAGMHVGNVCSCTIEGSAETLVRLGLGTKPSWLGKPILLSNTSNTAAWLLDQHF